PRRAVAGSGFAWGRCARARAPRVAGAGRREARRRPEPFSPQGGAPGPRVAGRRRTGSRAAARAQPRRSACAVHRRTGRVRIKRSPLPADSQEGARAAADAATLDAVGEARVNPYLVLPLTACMTSAMLGAGILARGVHHRANRLGAVLLFGAA